MSKTLQEDYRQAGFGNRLDLGSRPALLIVDFVKAYLDPDSPLYAGVEDALAASADLLKFARTKGIPALHTNVSYSPGGLDGGIFFRKIATLKCFEQGSPLGEFPDELQPLPHEPVVTKQYTSAFFGTSLASTLTANGVDTLVIAGLTTSGCVRATAVDAMQHGFVPVVVREAVGDRHPKPHEASLFDLQAKYAEVLYLNEVKQYLSDVS